MISKPRYVLEISYNGTRYHGWQIQQNAHTLQAELNSALQTLFSAEIETLASGRTDTGVHALQQYVQFDTNTLVKDNFLYQLNCILPNDIYIKNIYTANSEFSVRHDAISRTYKYWISLKKEPFKENLCYQYFKGKPDLEKMNEGAKIILSNKNFQSFCKYHSDANHFECNIINAYWEETEQMIVFTITANRFLRGMVRAIVGTLLELGNGKINVETLEKIILLKDRKASKEAVPPQGLYLTYVEYKPDALTLFL